MFDESLMVAVSIGLAHICCNIELIIIPQQVGDISASELDQFVESFLLIFVQCHTPTKYWFGDWRARANVINTFVGRSHG